MGGGAKNIPWEKGLPAPSPTPMKKFDLGDLGLDELVQTLGNAKERAVVLLN